MNIDAGPLTRAAGLTCWSGPVQPEPIAGGLTNTNFLVRDRGEVFFVRIGEDNPVHGILRSNELAAARAAETAGISPAIVHSQDGVIVSRFIEGRTLTATDVQDAATLERIVPLVIACHREIPIHLRGPASMFWPFHVIRNYAASVSEAATSPAAELVDMLDRNTILEGAVGRIEVVFGHNDLLAANIIDDGDRLWLVDWDYAGFNSPLFDLAGLASNNELPPVLELYFESHVDTALLRRFHAMKCVSLLRETLWSMVSETHSKLDIDFAAYTQENLAKFETEYDAFDRLNNE